MKKLLGLTVATTAILSSVVLGTTAMAAEVEAPASSLAKPAIVRVADNSDNDSARSFMEGQQRRYEAYIDQEVANGNLTQEEADELKSDFETMAEYCNRVNSRAGSGSAGGFGCH